MIEDEQEDGTVGVIIVGHGGTASQLVAAARAIVGPGPLDDLVAIDAGAGQTPALATELFRTIAEVDRGAGVLLIVDLLGASPCMCGLREGAGHRHAVLSGLNLAMLLKLASLDRRRLTPTTLAAACADSAQRSVSVRSAEEMR